MRRRGRYLTIISDDEQRLERLIGELLDLARLEGGGGSVRVERVPVADLFDRVTARHEHASRSAGVTLRTAIEPGAERVTGDRDRLEQALQNLAANAIRYAPRGSTLRLAARPVAGGVALSVEDEGAEGIAASTCRTSSTASTSGRVAGRGQRGKRDSGCRSKAIVERHAAGYR
jgi:signal transduction histidine kinase